MSNTEFNGEVHLDCVNRFVQLANTMKEEGIDIAAVSNAMMSASGVYVTYVVGGNEGGLTESGVEKVAAVYKRELQRIQDAKKKSSDL